MVTTRRSARYLLALLVVPLVVLSGCGKINAGFVIKDEDHIDVAVTVGVPTSGVNEEENDRYDGFATRIRDCSTIISPGSSLAGNVRVTSFSDGTYVGCTITGTMTSADLNTHIPWPQCGATPSSGPANRGANPIDIAFDDRTIHFHVDGSAFSDCVPGIDSRDIGGGADVVNFRVSVAFPGTVLSHSGSSTVDGNTVTWTDVNDLVSAQGLTAAGKDESGLPSWVWGIGALVALAIGGAVAAVVVSATRPKRR
ncbi:hypothetical protein FYJ43_08260 [Cutibacterium sp. WCA-380-WT-3A]|uniref:LppM domain-containing protein n=1 Tax=Cutibacterium porci TaxID=2605781 RepID=A0A7K0J7U2_9ACTN|nr:hypothetical protein [Cutibacterium porci]MSS46031.1 hypothetical protein [Cutibacterium porci]